MKPPTESGSQWRAALAWLREELAPTPGRTAAVARVAMNCAITVAVAMVFEIPLPAYMAYIVFIVSQEESVGSVITAVGGFLAGTLAIALSLAFYMIDASEPALRLPLMALSTFLGMYLARTSTLGPIAFLVSFVLVISQTLGDVIPSTEALTRLVLWLWVVVMFPAALTTLVEIALGRNPGRLALQRGLHLLDTVTATLEGRNSSELTRHRIEALKLLELRQHAQLADRRLRARAEVDHHLIETLVELLSLLRALPASTPPKIREWLADASRGCRRALTSEHIPVPSRRTPPLELLAGLTEDVLPIVTAIADALGRLGEDIAHRRVVTETPRAPTMKRLFVPDAWSNPEHARFALKTTIAVMAAYFIYTMLDWQGARTSVTTCFFVALGSLGETMHKLTLRIGGALIGGAAAVLSIVYALPQMTDIGQLCLLITAVSAIGAWFATSSERLSYFGMQMAFAFFLGVLHDYGPTMELATARDRVVGILLGNVLMTIVFSVMWPSSALDRARAAMAKALANLGRLMAEAMQPPPDTRLAAAQSLVEARNFTSIAVFEAGLLRRSGQRGSFEASAADELDRLATAVFAVAAQPSEKDIGEAARRQDVATSTWLAETARCFAAGKTAPPPPDRGFIAAANACLPAAASPFLRAAIDARSLLQREIEHVASTPTA